MLHRHTPLIHSLPLSHQLNKTIHFKMDCWQPSGSFKNRGISVLCEHLVAIGSKSLICSSGGNAGLAVAYAGRKLGVPVTVFVPETTSAPAIDRIKLEGAEVRIVGKVWDEADAAARNEAAKQKAGFVPPFDHPLIWEGHATLIDELIQETEKPDAILLSVGGGGLLCGVAEGLARHGWEDVSILGVETEGCASFHAAVEAGHLVTLPDITSICTSLGAKRVAAQALKVAQTSPVESVVTTDARAVQAALQFADEMRTLVEPACGASLSLVYDNHPSIARFERIVVIVCGGTGVSLEQLEKWKNVFDL
jgi:L-serine/L-threonine ammonia-lyase